MKTTTSILAAALLCTQAVFAVPDPAPSAVGIPRVSENTFCRYDIFCTDDVDFDGCVDPKKGYEGCKRITEEENKDKKWEDWCRSCVDNNCDYTIDECVGPAVIS